MDNATVNEIFHNANNLASAHLPDYDESAFIKEFQDSDQDFNVFRKWIYIRHGVCPSTTSKVVDDSILLGFKQTRMEVIDGRVQPKGKKKWQGGR